ncbi:hypothetical protein HHK36_001321 [Tetracentron sinense]|uniref:No apical meristem-associated C-terminal domain-containing protein n=1 Tax=Tetracentron sinense TaxID=13715 RepID=A0A835DUX1_TETSI|nr:hypothetical protein HHK36_001321 [Tetracentron sinense]
MPENGDDWRCSSPARKMVSEIFEIYWSFFCVDYWILLAMVENGDDRRCITPLLYNSNICNSPEKKVGERGESYHFLELNAFLIHSMQKLQDDLQKIGEKIKHHEEKLKFLKTQANKLDESILDMQVSLGKYHSSSVSKTENESLNHFQTEEETIEQILQKEKSAAGMLCQLKIRHESQASHLALTKDVLGIVATLAKVDDENLSRLFSEYLGLETMLAIVCKTYEGVKALELHEREGKINMSSGLHGLGPSIGRPMDGRFIVICLEDLRQESQLLSWFGRSLLVNILNIVLLHRPYVGEFVADDPQRKLALLKPRLPSGECPPGFLGFAVNMINVDSMNVSCLTASGHGLRETLFYGLFSRLQVYRTRADMLLSLPCISDGALSLDGGMIRSIGVFSLGNRKDVDVRFPISSGTSNLPSDYIETEDQIKVMKWEKERIVEDMQREQALLDYAKKNFEQKKLEFVKFLAESSSYLTQLVDAKVQYWTLEGKNFKLDHCWTILQYSIKWQINEVAKYSKTPTTATDSNQHFSSSSRMPDTPISLNSDQDPIGHTVDSPGTKRPSGRKAEKEVRRKSRVEKTSSFRICNLIEKFNKQACDTEERKARIEERKIRIMEDMNEREQKEEDDTIMMLDTSNMDPIAKAYYKQRKSEVLAKILAHATSSNLYVPLPPP